MVDMKGKTVIVTGAGSGIGLATADELARAGASLILVELDPQRGIEAIAQLENYGPRPRLLLADLSVQVNVRRVAADILASTPKIDVLINNAGSWFNERRVTADGLEHTFALNHMAYFLLTHLLLDRIKESAPARIISVTSDGHAHATLDFDDLQSEKDYSGRDAYCRSKLANILFTRCLARRLQGTGVTANCLHPGRILTRFLTNVDDAPPEGESRETFWQRQGYLPPADGAKTPVYLASSPDVEHVNGGYFIDCRVSEPSEWARDDAAGERLWKASLRFSGLAPDSTVKGPSCSG